MPWRKVSINAGSGHTKELIVDSLNLSLQRVSLAQGSDKELCKAVQGPTQGPRIDFKVVVGVFLQTRVEGFTAAWRYEERSMAGSPALCKLVCRLRLS